MLQLDITKKVEWNIQTGSKKSGQEVTKMATTINTISDQQYWERVPLVPPPPPHTHTLQLSVFLMHVTLTLEI